MFDWHKEKRDRVLITRLIVNRVETKGECLGVGFFLDCNVRNNRNGYGRGRVTKGRNNVGQRLATCSWENENCTGGFVLADDLDHLLLGLWAITLDAILVSRYYNLWNIVKRRATTFRLFLKSGNIQKNKWQLGSKCSTDNNTLKTSFAFDTHGC